VRDDTVLTGNTR